MRRREFITLVGGGAAWPVVARAQQQPAMPVIGFLGASTPSSWAPWTSAFLQGLRERGWIDGSTVKIEYRWAEGRSQRYAEIAAVFVRLKVDLIVTVGSAVIPAKHAAASIPIVFALAVDPVASGMVASLARPGGNVTGFSVESIDLAGKRIEILRELLPGLQRIAVIADTGYSASVLEKDQVESSARKFGINVDVIAIRRPEDIAPAFDALKSGTQALYVCSGALVNATHARINTLALGARLPTMHADHRQGPQTGNPRVFAAPSRRGNRMKRREFIVLLGGTAAAWPAVMRAQQREKVATIGFLGPATPAVAGNLVAAFADRLKELGWVEGRNLTIEYRWAEGQSERYAKIASEFVALKVDLIVTWASAPVLAAKRATGVIPIVFAAQMDPVSVGVVASLSRPGGNVTGLSLQQTDTTSKRLELLREIVTNLRRLAILGNVDTPGVVLEMGEIERTARALGIDIITLKVRSAENIVPAVESIKGRADALHRRLARWQHDRNVYVVPGPCLWAL